MSTTKATTHHRDFRLELRRNQQAHAKQQKRQIIARQEAQVSIGEHAPRDSGEGGPAQAWSGSLTDVEDGGGSRRQVSWKTRKFTPSEKPQHTACMRA